MTTQRRDILKYSLAAAAASALPAAQAQVRRPAPDPVPQPPGIDPRDRVFITNEDSNTLVVIDPKTNTVESTINLTSFDEDPRPPFRYVTAGVAPTHAAMIHKPLYHGCIDAHGAVPSPDGRLLATSGRGSSNIYLDRRRAAPRDRQHAQPGRWPDDQPRAPEQRPAAGPRTARAHLHAQRQGAVGHAAR